MLTISSEDGLADLVRRFGEDQESYEGLVQLREVCGREGCVRHMLALFEQRRSGDLCEKAWQVTLTICLTDDDPYMDRENSELWTSAILAALRDHRVDIRVSAARVIHSAADKNTDERIVSALVKGLADDSEDVRFACGEALQSTGTQALPHLLEALSDEAYQRPHHNREDRCSSVWDILFTVDGMLGTHHPDEKDRKRCIDAIGRFLKHRTAEDELDPLDIWKAGDTLGEHIGGKDALEVLCGLADHPDARVRKSVVHGLSHIDEPGAGRQLRRFSDDPVESVRIEATKYIRALPSRPQVNDE